MAAGDVAEEVHVFPPEQGLDARHMIEDNPDRLLRLATAFRDAIERADRAKLGITFQAFPRGSCGDASPLLGRYLKDRGFADVTYVLGMRGRTIDGNEHSHAWLRVDAYIVDITADQFDEVDQRVIVARASAWHETFEAEDQSGADYLDFDAAAAANLGRIYVVILAVLDEPEPT
jgi:hypothetical protein